MPFGEECSAWERWLLKVREWLITGILACVPLVLSPEPPTLDSSQVSLVNSALPLPGPRVSGCMGNFVCLPSKGLSASPAVSDGQKPCCLSQLDVIWVPFQLWCCRLERKAWGLDPTFLKGNPPVHWHILAELQLLPMGAQPALSHLLCPPYQSRCGEVVFLSVHCCKASLQLVFSWLFRIISLQFSCNFRVVLGGG